MRTGRMLWRRSLRKLSRKPKRLKIGKEMILVARKTLFKRRRVRKTLK